MLLKSTCDLICEPIHNPDTLHSLLTLFSKQMWSTLFMRFRYVSLVMQFNRQVCLRCGHFGHVELQTHSTVMFALRSFGWPQHIFLHECSVCVGSSVSRLLILTTGVCLLVFLKQGQECGNATVRCFFFYKYLVFSLSQQIQRCSEQKYLNVSLDYC